jgi:hypothetical protein
MCRQGLAWHEGWCHCCDALRGFGRGAYSPAVAQKATGFGDPKNRALNNLESLMMNRYMPLTGHDCTVPALIIDTQAPLDVLHDAAVHRIRAVTQLLENLAFREQLSSDAVVLSDFAHLLAIPLRDGCDLLDVISRRLNAELS